VKIFERDGAWNFVDVNNAFVGFDSGQSCCEHAGYVLSRSASFDASEESVVRDIDAEPYSFDPRFFATGNGHEGLGEGGYAIFRLVADELEPIYLKISNSHNGYYGHGFSFTVGGKVVKGGTL
jgi:hypothetical protein